MKKKQPIKNDLNKEPISIKKIERANGIATIVFKYGIPVCSSWVRNK